MEIALIKVHGSMNTFYMFEGEERDDYAQLAKHISTIDPDIDGILVILPSTRAHAKMRVFNNDGSEASMCGNGLRCVARYVCEQQNIQKAVIETMKAFLSVRKKAVSNGEIATYAVEISPVSFLLNSVPMNYLNQNEWINKPLPFVSKDILFSAVSVPNPHLIGIVPATLQNDSSHQEKWAQYFNSDNEYFPDGVNVSYVTAVEKGIFVRTYERGVGFTNACGTAMTASALISCMSGLTPYGDVSVYNPGGLVKCTIASSENKIDLELSGNATYLAYSTFYWAQDDIEKSRILFVKNSQEQVSYNKFIEQVTTRSNLFS
ncbi:diaminopimelate epimerase [Planococcus versutus]|uniref:Diaminopimelate epimerase n=1 Tax=Planococcus versutus TaxID=1302659 RepID=A0A1B1S4Y6_9BACL|nr:diaminopimelate epimerase [Planococcus versutus]ANU28235.1 diaminopimelate epimerase [Planococcus versutus]